MKSAFGILVIILLAMALVGRVAAQERQALQVGRFQIVTVTYSCHHDEGPADSAQSVLLDTATGMTWSIHCLKGPEADKQGMARRTWEPFEWSGQAEGGKRPVPLPPLERYPYPKMKK
ncbi:MAG: hypothetical protein PVH82_05785 [Desulfobacteraceae bacterium]|jgi:hypothetical protein